MPDLSLVLNGNFPNGDFPFESLPAWQSVLETFKGSPNRSSLPHCWAVRAPLEWHSGILKAMSRLYLGGEGWSREEKEGVPSHPDLVVAGEYGKAANIEACRSMIKELSMKPVSAVRRLGALLSADKLLVSAANSLLKIAEEPPSHACLLFLMEGDDFLPTLRSRSRLTVLAAPLSYAASPMPGDEGQWRDWLASLNNSKDGVDMAELLSSWTSYFLQAGDVEAAARADRIRLLVLQKKLSQTMVCDLITLTLKEELPFEPILGGFW